MRASACTSIDTNNTFLPVFDSFYPFSVRRFVQLKICCGLDECLNTIYLFSCVRLSHLCLVVGRRISIILCVCVFSWHCDEHQLSQFRTSERGSWTLDSNFGFLIDKKIVQRR